MHPDFYAQWYHHETWYWWYSARATILESVLEGLPAARPAGRVLNIACGTGHTSERFRRFGPVVSLDYAPEALRFCAQRGLRDLVAADAARLPLCGSSVALVTACDILEHLRDDVRLLQECRRVLVPGGRALITVPALDLFWTGNDDLQHQRRYSRTELARKLRRAGLEIERLTYFNTLLLPLFPLQWMREWFFNPRITPENMIPPTPPLANGVFRAIFAAERHLLARGDLPIGVSLLAVARRG
ncbi:MAG: class I SAM-dependent methyltransferase [Planctomycetes bacterium]|nr:class I SAM-dependent methyltransferase [Planctomycetota bacterium]